MKTLQQIHNYLTDLGITFARLMVSLLVIALMLFPGLVFSYFLVKLAWFFMGGQDFIPLDKLFLYSVLGIVSWYVGMGVSKIIKPSENY